MGKPHMARPRSGDFCATGEGGTCGTPWGRVTVNNPESPVREYRGLSPNSGLPRSFQECSRFPLQRAFRQFVPKQGNLYVLLQVVFQALPVRGSWPVCGNTPPVCRRSSPSSCLCLFSVCCRPHPRTCILCRRGVNSHVLNG